MARHSNKQALLDAGLRVMFKQGFVGAAVRDVVAAAGVPHGSFTNHFPSKEQFGREVLDQYFDHVRQLLGASLEDRGLSPRARLERYLDLIVERLRADGFERGCLIGDLSIEVTQTSDLIRERLQVVFRQWLQPFAECLAEGQALGEFDARFDARELAEYFLASWEGAILRMKVERSIAPLDRFRTIFFSTISNSGAST
ncbi:TetR family transcriptional regulator C-terminal domain-containing protein [Fulvimonas sp. R45]|uniref:TetR family transcriptional regulator C-terminal domain-containing protein n=1 Tax=Fulvimonas sp. R45 TaxID=3045937 RepID=UPI00265E25B3|nr:TetR family transcriptional regulator C-terminal domain-containing protein [Fulvimonas sp. R45]MDO1527536.1 TetR family transcriptional regulator C-terminal domain-containing protein [Fulvimonas sp. R45]